MAILAPVARPPESSAMAELVDVDIEREYIELGLHSEFPYQSQSSLVS